MRHFLNGEASVRSSSAVEQAPVKRSVAGSIPASAAIRSVNTYTSDRVFDGVRPIEAERLAILRQRFTERGCWR